MKHCLKFTIPIIPKAQMRARHGRTKGGFSVTYKAAAQRQAEESLIALSAQYRPKMPLEGPLQIEVQVFIPIPKSWSKKRKEAAINGLERPSSRPDLDNYLKHIFDCLTQLSFWQDDSQIVDIISGKYYNDGNGPRWELEIKQAAQARTGHSPRRNI